LLTLVIGGFFFYDRIKAKVQEKRAKAANRGDLEPHYESYIDPYTALLDLSLSDLEYTQCRPSEFELTEFYANFTYMLPDGFLKDGNPIIKSYTAYYDTDNLEGV